MGHPRCPISRLQTARKFQGTSVSAACCTGYRCLGSFKSTRGSWKVGSFLREVARNSFEAPGIRNLCRRGEARKETRRRNREIHWDEEPVDCLDYQRLLGLPYTCVRSGRSYEEPREAMRGQKNSGKNKFHVERFMGEDQTSLEPLGRQTISGDMNLSLWAT